MVMINKAVQMNVNQEDLDILDYRIIIQQMIGKVGVVVVMIYVRHLNMEMVVQIVEMNN